MLGVIFWDVSKEIGSYNLPFLGRPVLWYGFFFAMGFFLGFVFLVYLLNRYFSQSPFFIKKELIKEQEIKAYLIEEKVAGKDLLIGLNTLLQKADPLKTRLIVEKKLKGLVLPLKNRAKVLGEKALVYAIIGAVVGARLADVFFYQDLGWISKDPLSIFKIWEGGLASHGGTLGALLGLYIFTKKEKALMPGLSFLGFLDFVCLPSSIVAGCIRIGNFFNQEILGTHTNVPWGVVFGHPIDGSAPAIRHPVSLYESFFYFSLAVILFFYSRKCLNGKKQGSLVGVFLVLVFGFRFLIEFFKEEQSSLMHFNFLTMGQILSVPLICIGLFFFFKAKPSFVK